IRIIGAAEEEAEAPAAHFHRFAADWAALIFRFLLKLFYLRRFFGHRERHFHARFGAGEELAHAAEFDNHRFAAVRARRGRHFDLLLDGRFFFGELFLERHVELAAYSSPFELVLGDVVELLLDVRREL